MKRKLHFFVLVLSLFLIKQEIIAVPAYPKPIVFRQPDGTTLSITLHGDERAKWAITSDGYTVLFNKKGFYEYAVKNANNDLVVSGIQAKDPAKRSQQEVDFISKIDKKLKYSSQQVSMLKSIWQIKEEESLSQKAFPTTGDRKLICILIGYTDKAFTKTQSDFNNLLNQVSYSTDGASGSVKDFYLESSYDQFNLTVDVAGPYTASNNMAYYGANDVMGYDVRPRELVTEAVNLANASVNYANYDNDNDGTVDGVYVIYAGYGEEAGAPANTIWAHAWSISPVTLDGKIISRYSCSSELRGTAGTNLTRIGVICHEFGHVLGAPDYYDTDYSGSGGDYEGTGYWDVMASGSWNNNGATPANHNAYTKVVYYNWATATTLTSGAVITLYNAAENSNSFYKFNTTTANEFFIMENRHQVGFDASIPGQGLIIYHVHKDINTAASSNDINVSHPQMMYPVCASATGDPTSSVSSYGSINSGGCPFPGTSSKTSFTDATLPSSKSWAGANTNKPITSISRNSVDKTITLTFMGGGDPDDPTNFAAGAVSTSQIDLSWTKNAGRDVLLAWSANGVFGTPSDGVNYTASSSIPGGGTVIYAGGNSTFSHTSLAPGTNYYYKIWTKIDGTPTWSNGVTTDAKTQSEIGAPQNLTAQVINTNDVLLAWDPSSSASFADGFESGDFSAWSDVIDGPGTPGATGFAHWYVQSILTSYVYEGSYGALTNWGYNIDTWLVSQAITATSETVLDFYWNSSYAWHVDPYDHGDLFVKVSLDGGSTWEPYLWTFGEIGVWSSWTWYQTTLNLSAYSGENIMVAFNIVANDNADIALDNIFLGNSSDLIQQGTFLRSSPSNTDAKSKVATDNGSVNKPEQSISRSVFAGYAVYRDGNKIGETNSTTYTDENLAIGTYTYYVTAMFTSPVSESGPSNEVEAEITSIPSGREADIKRLPVGYYPTIDGQADLLWDNVEANNIDLNFTGETPTLNNATWKAVWNDNNIFVLVEVSENSFWPSWMSGLTSWQSDNFEVYLDVNELLQDGGGPVLTSISGHYQFAPDFSETDQGTVHIYNGADVADTWSQSPASYIYEYSIPFTAISDIDGFELDPYSRTEIGFDLCVIDLDEGQITRNRAVWSNIGTTAENWNSMDDAGIINFVTDEIEPPVREADIKRLPDGYSPTIDGQADLLWDYVDANNIDLDFTGEFPTLNTATWKAVWNDNNIFVLVEVSENSFWPSWLSGLTDWESDKPEVYFDVNEVLQDGGGPVPGSIAGHYQFAPNFSETDQGTVHFYNGASVADTWSEDPASYVYEYEIPFTSMTDVDGLDLDPFSRTVIGFDLCVTDLDEGQIVRNRAVWSNTGITAENWNSMDDAGIINFVTEEIEPPVIEPPQNLTAQVIHQNDVKLEWDEEELPFSDGFESGDFSAWSDVIEGSGTAGGGGFAYWHVQSGESSYIWEGSYSAIANYGYNIDTWIISPAVAATSESVVSFYWKSSYYWHVDPFDNGDLFVKISLNGGITWDPIWTFGEIGSWTSWAWYKTTIYLSSYAGNNIMVAFNIVANDNGDVALDKIYLGDDVSGSMPMGTILMSNPGKTDAKSKVDIDRESVNRPEESISRSVVSGYAVYRDGDKIAQTLSNTYTDEDLDEGTYNYYVTFVYTSPNGESGPSNDVDVEISYSSIPSTDALSSMNVTLYPVPVKDKLNVVLYNFKGSVNLEIYNLLGKIAYQGIIECQEAKQSEQIMLNGIAPGMYYLKVSNKDKTNITKFTIE